MRFHNRLCRLVGIVGAMAFTPTMAANLTVYNQSTNETAILTPDWLEDFTNQTNRGGGRFVSESDFFANANLTDKRGSAKVACIELTDRNHAQCMRTFVFNNPDDSISAMGFFSEQEEIPSSTPPCTVVGSYAIVGGTGKYSGVRGQLKITHTALNYTGNCVHTTHGYKFEFILLSDNNNSQ